MSLVASGKLEPRRLVRRIISLSEAPDALAELGRFNHVGITVIQMP
jgi:alcohol dehydrogenase